MNIFVFARSLLARRAGISIAWGNTPGLVIAGIALIHGTWGVSPGYILVFCSVFALLLIKIFAEDGGGHTYSFIEGIVEITHTAESCFDSDGADRHFGAGK